jgi:hypothetical protein
VLPIRNGKYYFRKRVKKMSEKQKPQEAFSLLVAWTFANLLGWAAGLVAAGILAPLAARSPFPWHYDTDMAIAYVSLVLLGITIGIAQWIVLRRHLPRATPWIFATIIGYLLSVIIFAIANNDAARLLSTEVVNNLILFGLMGIAIGASQWWVLRRHYGRSGLWVLASTVGFLFFMWLVIDPAHSQGELLIRGAILGGFAAAVTGGALVWIIHQPLAMVSRQPA